MDSDFKKELEAVFRIKIRRIQSVRGGDIAHSYLIHAQKKRYFAKIMPLAGGWEMIQAETEGLGAIKATHTLKTPEVVGAEQFGGGGCLLLEYIRAGAGTERSFKALGRGLAQMHNLPAPFYGWRSDNFIGLLPQSNIPGKDWAVFFVDQRLSPQYNAAVSHGRLRAEEIPGRAKMVRQISLLTPEISPSLVHGDLWGGNFLISETGEPYLIDPAVHYGHAEVDLAMSHLFGGFPESFYASYHEINPPSKGLEARMELYQLYYLLVHLNLFGKSYYRAVTNISAKLFGR